MFSIHSIHLKPSKRLLAWICLLSLTSAGLVFAIDVAPWIQALFGCFIATVFFFNLFNHVGRYRIHTIRRQRNEFFELQSDKQCWQDMQLCAESKISPYWVVLHFRAQNKFWVRKSVVILPDAMPETAYRRLRVMFKFLYPSEKILR